jgi:hypothetical protein
MISKSEFKKALRIIEAYQLQKRVNKDNLKSKPSRKINIEAEISNSLFCALKNYYRIEFSILIEKSDLKNMDVNLLEKIDYIKLSRYRGIGPILLSKFKKIMISNSIINS